MCVSPCSCQTDKPACRHWPFDTCVAGTEAMNIVNPNPHYDPRGFYA